MKIIKKNKLHISILVFIMTSAIIAIAYAVNGIYPGSEKSIMIYDMGSQYVSTYAYLHYIGQNYNSLIYQNLSGMGGGFFGSISYLASPLTIIVFLFPVSSLPDVLYFLTIFKLSLSGFTFSLFIINGHLKSKNEHIILIASIAYSLMSFNIVYSLNIMWLDGIIMLPLVIWGMDRIFEKKKSLLFSISLTLTIIFNYYLAYIVFLFVVLYFFYYSFSYKLSIKYLFIDGFKFLYSGTIALLLSAWLWIPTFIDLKKGKFSDVYADIHGLIRYPIGILRQIIPFSYSGFTPDEYPFVYSGLIITVAFFAYFLVRNISLRKKISALAVTILFLLSFMISELDYIWHGFRIPNMYPARYSFLMSFFMITLFAEVGDAILHNDYFQKKKIIIYLMSSVFVLDVGINSVYLISSMDKDPTLGGYLNRKVFNMFYEQTIDVKDYLVDGRLVSDYNFSSNDGLLYGVSILDSFSSSYNQGLSDFMMSLGFSSVKHDITSNGITPVTASFLGVNNYLARFEGDDRLYKNDNMISEFYNSVYSDGMLNLYTNPFPLTPGIIMTSDNIEMDSFDWNAFENINKYISDLTRLDNVFTEISKDELWNEGCNENGYYVKEITLYPKNGDNVFFYIPPKNYYENDYINYDELYYGDRQIALYKNSGYENIVYLGISDGSPLDFTYISNTCENNALFYTLDKNVYYEAVDVCQDNMMDSYSISNDGMTFEISLDKPEKMLLLLPYEKGYYFKIDGENIEYDSYRNALISINIPKGYHYITIEYFTPGLKVGLIISGLSLLIIICVYSLYYFSKRRLSNDNS